MSRLLELAASAFLAFAPFAVLTVFGIWLAGAL